MNPDLEYFINQHELEAAAMALSQVDLPAKPGLSFMAYEARELAYAALKAAKEYRQKLKAEVAELEV
jgi:hypothetical protein